MMTMCLIGFAVAADTGDGVAVGVPIGIGVMVGDAVEIGVAEDVAEAGEGEAEPFADAEGDVPALAIPTGVAVAADDAVARTGPGPAPTVAPPSQPASAMLKRTMSANARMGVADCDDITPSSVLFLL